MWDEWYNGKKWKALVKEPMVQHIVEFKDKKN